MLEYPLIGKRRYLEMRQELAALEDEIGGPLPPDSATHRLGHTQQPSIKTVSHAAPWPSPPSLRSPAELRRYHEGVVTREGQGVAYVGGARLTGVEVGLRYVGGILEQAVSRGHGGKGEDLTVNIRTIGSVPLALRPPGSITESRVTRLTKQALGPSTTTPVPPFPESLVVRGIVTARLSDLAALDRRRIDAGDAPYVDPLAAVETSLRQLDGRVTSSRPLRFFAHGVAQPQEGLDSTWQLLGALKSWGFRVVPLAWRCVGFDEVLDFVSALQQAKPGFEYPLEGGMLSIGRIAEEEGAPRSVLLSFASLGKKTAVASVYRAVGRGGGVSPVALLDRSKDPDGALPEGAPIPAMSGGRVLPLEAGAAVRVLSGAVAPYVVAESLGETKPSPSVSSPLCPSCQATLTVSAEDPFARCENPACKGRARARVLHLVGPRGLALSSITPRVAESLLGQSRAPLADLYALDPIAVERAQPGAAEAFKAERDRHRRLPLWKVLHLASISAVSERAARLVASYFEEVDPLIEVGPARLAQVPGLPPEAVAPLTEWLEGEGRILFGRLSELDVRIEGESTSFAAPFRGKTLVLAGKLDRYTAEQVAEEVERRAGTLDLRVSRNTDFVILGRDPGEAVALAEAYNVLTLDEAALASVLRQT